MAAPQEPSVIVSFSTKDAKWHSRIATKLQARLSPHGIGVWSSTQIGLGEAWNQAIMARLHTAQAAALLLSSHYFNSPYIGEQEMPLFEERRKASGRPFHLLPILVEPGDWLGHAWIAEHQLFRPSFIGPGDVLPALSEMTEAQAEAAMDEYAEQVAGLLAKPTNEQPVPLSTTVEVITTAGRAQPQRIIISIVITLLLIIIALFSFKYIQRLPKTRHLTINLITPEGRPIDETVELTVDALEYRQHYTVTNASKQVRLVGIPPLADSVTFELEANHWCLGHGAHYAIPKEGPLRLALVQCRLDTLKGTVLANNGGLAGVAVIVGQLRDTTDVNGYYELVIPKKDWQRQYTIRYEKEGYETKSHTVYPDSKPPTVTLYPVK